MVTLTGLPHYKVLRARAHLLVGNETDADDLVQETVERALRTFSHFQPGTAALAWLLTILRSVWIDSWRRRRRDVPDPLDGRFEPCQPAVDPPDLYDFADLIIARLPAATARLSPKLREVMELRLSANWSYQAIAARLRVPLATVGTRMLRARRQLARILQEELRLEPELTAVAPALDSGPGPSVVAACRLVGP